MKPIARPISLAPGEGAASAACSTGTPSSPERSLRTGLALTPGHHIPDRCFCTSPAERHVGSCGDADNVNGWHLDSAAAVGWHAYVRIDDIKLCRILSSPGVH